MTENIPNIFHSKEYQLENQGYFQRLYQLILNNTHDIVTIHKMPDLSYEYINNATIKALGYSKDELYGHSIFDIIHPDDLNSAQRVLKDIVYAADLKFEIRYLRKDGTSLWVEVNGAILPYTDKDNLMIIIARDINDRKQIEESLYLYENRYQSIVEDQTELICRYNPDTMITFVNRAFCEAFKRTSDELIGKSLIYLISEVSQEEIYRFLSNFKKEKPVKSYIYPITLRNGHLAWYEWTTRAIFNLTEEIIEFQVVARDITEHYKAKETLQTAIMNLEIEIQERTEELKKVNEVLTIKSSELIETEKELRESKNYYQTIFENTGAITIIIEADMRVSMANEKCAETLGISREELIGREWTEFIPEHLHILLKERHRLRRLEPKSVPNQYSIEVVCRQGQRRMGILEVAMIPGTTKSVATFIDLTDYYKIDRALSSISAVNIAMVRSRSERKLLDTVCHSIVNMGGYCSAWVGYLVDAPGQGMEIIASAGNDNGFIDKLNVSLENPKQSNGSIGKAIKTGKAVVFKDHRLESDVKYSSGDVIDRGYCSSIVIPLLNGNKVFGTLHIYSEERTEFNSEEEHLLTDMANNLAYAITSLRARENLRRANKECGLNLDKMHQLLLQSVSSLGNVVSIRDPYTAGHQIKVARLAVAIATEMGLSKTQIESIEVAASLHDIGKLNIPGEILNKPGRLSPLELDMIKTHPRAGYEIIKDIEFPWPVAEIMLQHHERMNGTGYPRGISADEIMMEARIIAVADVVDSMATHRPFRPALGIKKALSELEEKKGELFDAKVVEACINLFREKRYKLQNYSRQNY